MLALLVEATRMLSMMLVISLGWLLVPLLLAPWFWVLLRIVRGLPTRRPTLLVALPWTAAWAVLWGLPWLQDRASARFVASMFAEKERIAPGTSCTDLPRLLPGHTSYAVERSCHTVSYHRDRTEGPYDVIEVEHDIPYGPDPRYRFIYVPKGFAGAELRSESPFITFVCGKDGRIAPERPVQGRSERPAATRP